MPSYSLTAKQVFTGECVLTAIVLMNASLSVPIIGISFSPDLESSQPIFWAGSYSSSSSWISLALLIRIDSIGLANIRNRSAVSCTSHSTRSSPTMAIPRKSEKPPFSPAVILAAHATCNRNIKTPSLS
jgi:hypothetical protein